MRTLAPVEALTWIVAPICAVAATVASVWFALHPQAPRWLDGWFARHPKVYGFLLKRVEKRMPRWVVSFR